jgi:polyketide cyclase/dehydrase/lipid transport protein
MQQLDQDDVSITVAARPEDVYALAADVTRTPDFSPEVVGCRWLGGATGPVVGARFEAVNRSPNGRTWKNHPVVTVAEPGREFAFTRTEPFAGTIAWRYHFEPDSTGTRVTLGYEVQRPVSPLGWLLIEKVYRGHDRRNALHAGMRTTLERLRAAAEATVTSD